MSGESNTSTRCHLQERHGAHFSSPWHVCIHGLGLGDSVIAGVPDDAKQLLRLSNALREHQGGQFSLFTRHVLSIALWGTPGLADSLPSVAGPIRYEVSCAFALVESFEETQQLVAAAALIVEVLAAAGWVAEFRPDIERCLMLGLSSLRSLPVRSDSDRYAALSASFVLFNAIRASGCTHCLRACARRGSPYLAWAVRVLNLLEDRFYKARAAAILFTIVSSAGLTRESIAACAAPLEASLRAAKAIPATSLPPRPSDGIHAGNDYLAFEVSLLLSAGMPRSKPDTAAELQSLAVIADRLIRSLSPPSLASQFAFYADAMLAVGLRSADPLRAQFTRCLDEYLLTPVSGDSYLRCTYLAYAAMRLGCEQTLPNEVFDRINLALISHRSVLGGYFGFPAVASYAVYARSLGSAPRGRLVGLGDIAERIENGPREPYRFKEERKLSYAMIRSAFVMRNSCTAEANRVPVTRAPPQRIVAHE